jgi:hypothetical protein
VELAYALDHEERRDIILEKMPNNYEMFFIATHGTVTQLYIGGLARIGKDEVLANPPGAMYIALESCNTGAFQNQDYLAGWFLFAGDALIVKANTVATFYIVGSFKSDDYRHLGSYMPMGTGVDFGTIYKHDNGGQQTMLFGDPTLTVRPKSEPKLASDTVEFYTDSLDLDSMGPYEEIIGDVSVKNHGTGNLKLMLYTFTYNWSGTGNQSVGLRIMPFDDYLNISDKFTWSIGGRRRDTDGIGVAKHGKVFYTNDPFYPYLYVNATAATW